MSSKKSQMIGQKVGKTRSQRLARAARVLLAALALFQQSCSGASGAPPVSIPAPTPAKLRVTSPDAGGQSTVAGDAGAVTGGNTVRVTNLTAAGAPTLQALSAIWDFLIPSAWAQAATTVEVTANPDGSFSVRIAASVGDRLSVIQIDPSDGEESAATELLVPDNSPPLGFSPAAVTVDGSGRGYAVGSSGGTGVAATVDLGLNTVLGLFDLSTNEPRSVAYNPGNDKLVVADTANDVVVFIDLSNPLSQNPVAVTGPQSVAVDTLSNRAVVGTTDPAASVVLIDLGSETVFASAPIANAANPAAVYQGTPAVDAANGRAVLVSNFDDGSSQITAKDVAAPAFLNFEVVPDSLLQGVALTALDQALATDASGNRVLFADLSGATAASVLAVGSSPRSVAFDAAGNLGLVANFDDHTVSVVDVIGRTVVQTREVGLNPLGVAHFDLGAITLVGNGGNDSVSLLH